MKCHNCALRDAKPCMECSMCMSGDSHFIPLPKAPKKTNADRIRRMSDEELAEFLAEEQHRIASVVFRACGIGLEKQVIYARRLEWLRQIAEEDA